MRSFLSGLAMSDWIAGAAVIISRRPAARLLLDPVQAEGVPPAQGCVTKGRR